MSVKQAEPTDCPICDDDDDINSGDELVDHLTDDHDAFTKLVRGEYHE